ncbi:MAG: hypothetical protein ACM3OC_09870, partial [Deltaproteobacteria bacterium]
MSKRLFVFALIALTVCFVSTAYAEVQNVKVGGDLTIAGVVRNDVNQAKGNNKTDVSGVASIARVKVDANLTDNVDVTFRLLNERAWGTLDTE